MFDLTGRTAIVTGGGRGLGRHIAQVLAAAGASLFLAGRDTETLARARDEIGEQFGARVEFRAADLSDRAAVCEMAAAATARFGHVDIAIHNAGMPSTGMVDDFADGDWDRVMETNLMPAAWLTRALSPGMKEHGWGRFVFISSAAAYRAFPTGHATYSASKSALHGLARAAAVELGPFGITVNCIAAGTFLTDMAQSVASESGLLEAMAGFSAVKRVGEKHEIEGPVLLLASDAGSYVTGQVIGVDGGFSVRA